MADPQAAAIRPASTPAHPATRADLERLGGYPFVVVSWIDDAGYPLSVATDFKTDVPGGRVSLRRPANAAAIPIDRELSVIGSHIRPRPGEGYDERRYLQLWGRAATDDDAWLTFMPTRAWGWDEAEVPFFEYSERAVPQSRRYLALLSAEKGRAIRPRLSPFWLALRTTRGPFLTAALVPVLLGIAIAASHGTFTWWTALLTVIGASLAHLGFNVANDVFDTLSGADEANVTPTQFSGGSRVAIYDLVTVRGLAILSGALIAAAVAIGLVLVLVTRSPLLFWLGLVGIILGIAYTAPPLKLVYRGLGEVTIAFGFGPIMLLGAYVVQTGRLALEPLVASVPVAILVALILYVNEIPDRASDAAAGKRTLPVRLSRKATQDGYFNASLAAFAAIVVGVTTGILPLPAVAALVAIPLALRVNTGIRQHFNSPYALMAVMGTNITLHLAVGGLLLLSYLITIVVAAFAS